MDLLDNYGGSTPFGDLTNTSSGGVQSASNSQAKVDEARQREREREKARLLAAMTREERNEKYKKPHEAYHLKRAENTLAGGVESDKENIAAVDNWLHRNDSYQPMQRKKHLLGDCSAGSADNSILIDLTTSSHDLNSGRMQPPQWKSCSMGDGPLCNSCWSRLMMAVGAFRAPATETTSSKPWTLQESNNPVFPSCRLSRSRSPPSRLSKRTSHRGKNHCLHCGVLRTPRWRKGPMGPRTLCNACGLQHSKGRLFTEYHPLASPTFKAGVHSNQHKQVLQIIINQERVRKEQQQQQKRQPQVTEDVVVGGDDMLMVEPFLLDGPAAPMIIDGDDAFSSI